MSAETIISSIFALAGALVPLFLCLPDDMRVSSKLLWASLYLGNPYMWVAALESPWKLWYNVFPALQFLALRRGYKIGAAVCWFLCLSFLPLVGIVTALPVMLFACMPLRSPSKGILGLPAIVSEAAVIACAVAAHNAALALPALAILRPSPLLSFPLPSAQQAFAWLFSSETVREKLLQLISWPRLALATVDAGSREPELSLYWYLFSAAFHRYKAFYVVTALGQPLLYILPVVIRFR
jgi:hypothetical protein